MTCYFWHLQEIFKKAGIEITSQNKHEVDSIIHELVGVDYRNCPATWKEVKKRIADDKEDFVSQLKTAWKNPHKQLAYSLSSLNYCLANTFLQENER